MERLRFYQERSTGWVVARILGEDGKPIIREDDRFDAYGVSKHPTGGLIVRIWSTHKRSVHGWKKVTKKEARKIDLETNYGFFGPYFGRFFEEIGVEGRDWIEA